MRVTYIIVYFTLSLSLINKSFTQDNKYPATLGIDFDVSIYNKTNVPGVSINYTKGFSKKYGYMVMIAGSFPDSMRKGLTRSENRILLEGNAAVIRKLADPVSDWQPYLLGGIGINYYEGYYGGFIPLGVGLQTRISEDIFASVNIQRRINISNGFNSRYFFSVGLSGMLSKKKQNNKKDVHLPVLSVLSNHALQTSDKDHDGVADDVDKCPDSPGLLSEHGCPEIIKSKSSAELLLDSLAKNIFFESNSSVLKPESYLPLNEVANVLSKYPKIILQIEGHTDSIGSEEDNLSLSNARAAAVLTYLNKKGILPYRLQSAGFGETKPIADNSTNESRMLNRRVELKVKKS